MTKLPADSKRTAGHIFGQQKQHRIYSEPAPQTFCRQPRLQPPPFRRNDTTARPRAYSFFELRLRSGPVHGAVERSVFHDIPGTPCPPGTITELRHPIRYPRSDHAPVRPQRTVDCRSSWKTAKPRGCGLTDSHDLRYGESMPRTGITFRKSPR